MEGNNRKWKAISKLINSADIFNKKGNEFLLSVRKKKEKNTKNTIDNFQLYPNFNVLFQDIIVKKDCIQMLQLLQDTLLMDNNKPVVKIIYFSDKKKVEIKGKLVGFIGTLSDDGLYVNNKKSHNFHLNIKYDRVYKLPDTINNFQIIFIGKLLTSDRFKYGFCNKVGCNFFLCSDKDYINNIDNTHFAYGRSICNPFDLTKGSPKQFCQYQCGN